MKALLQGKTAIITGGSGGIGRATAELFLAEAANVVITARRQQKLDEAVQALSASGGKVIGVVADSADRDAPKRVFEQAIDAFGKVELNFFAAVELSREVLPYMRQQQSGHILNLTSIAGMVAFPGSGLYNASKFALEGFTEALHHEVKHLGIRVTLIEPGAFRTDFASSAAMKAEGQIEAYAPLTAGMDDYYTTQNGQQMGDPIKGMQVVIDMVESDSAPVRLLLGEDAYQLWDGAIESRARDLAKWRERGKATAIPGALKNPVEAL